MCTICYTRAWLNGSQNKVIDISVPVTLFFELCHTSLQDLVSRGKFKKPLIK